MYLLYKKSGETCLEAINRLKNTLLAQNKEQNRGQNTQRDQTEPQGLTYAGRLDPLARGVLPILTSADLKEKDRILNLPKTYEFEVVFGVVTDSFDGLGVLNPSTDFLTWKTLNINKDSQSISDLKKDIQGIVSLKTNDTDVVAITAHKQILNNSLKKLVGSVEVFYPFYSSKPVGGIPLFQYTKDNGLESTNKILPIKKTALHNIECLDITFIDFEVIKNESIDFAKKVSGDFRQNEIISSWTKNDSQGTSRIGVKLPVVKCSVTCSSGFYVRSLACFLGQLAGIGAIARDINRISVGDYSLNGLDLLKID